MDERGVARRAILAGAALGVTGSARAKSLPVFHTLRYEMQAPACIITVNRGDSDNVAGGQTRRELPLAWQVFRVDYSLKLPFSRARETRHFAAGRHGRNASGFPARFPTARRRDWPGS